MKKIYLITIIICFIHNIFAADLTGIVRSALNGSPLAGANVTLLNSNFGTATNYKGEFRFDNLPAGNYQVDIHYVGYKIKEPLTVNLDGSNQASLNILMEEELMTAEDIIVTGTRTQRLIKDSPVATEIINAEEIKSIGAENVGEVLEERAGIIVTQDGVRGGMLSAQLQGLNDNHTLILIDGMPVIGRIAGSLDLSRVSIQNIKRIEIVKGAASALYGSEAVGGVINIITRDAEESLKLNGEMKLGNFNSRDAKISTESLIGNNSFIISAENHFADGFDLDPSTSNTTADQFNNYTFFSKYTHKISDKYSINANGEYFTQSQEGIDGGLRKTDTKNWYFNIANNWLFEDYSKLVFRVYHSQFTKKINRASVLSKNVEDYSKGELIYNTVFANHLVTFGGELTDNRLNANRIENNNKRIYNFSAYAQDEIIYKRIEFNFGARLDYHSQFKTYISPKAGFLYKPTDSWRIRGSYSRGFRSPDFIELFLVLDHSGLSSQPYIAYGNSNLKPETSSSLNIGTEYHFSNDAVVKLNFFNNNLSSMISSKFLYTNNEGVQFYTYENLTDAYTRGVEFDLYVHFLKYFNTTAGYSFIRTKDVGNNQPFFNRPKNSARVKLGWNFNDIGFSGNVRWRYIGDRLFVNINGQPTTAPWYATWYSRIDQKIYKTFSIFLGVDNIFDYTDRSFVALPGRLMYIGITLK